MSHPFSRLLGRCCGSLLLVAALSACVGDDHEDSAADQYKVLASQRQSDGAVVAASGFNVGDYVVLQAPAGGDAGASYQWYRNGVAIEGATGASYELGQASSLDDSAEFSVRVSSTANPAGTLSQPLLLSVKAGEGIDLLAGYVGGAGNLDGLGVHARFSTPRSLRHDAAGNLYLRDGNQIRKISPDGQVTTVVSASQLQAAESPPYSWLKSMTIDASGNVYVVSNSSIHKFPYAGGAPTLVARLSGQAPVDGDAASARFFTTDGIASDAAGNLYLSDSCTIRKIAPNGNVSTLAGAAGECRILDGAGRAARLRMASIQAVDAAGAVYVLDRVFYMEALIRKIDADGKVSTLNQQMQQVSAVLGVSQAEWEPRGLALDKTGNLHLLAHVKQIGSLVILKISPSGVVEKLAGGGQYGDASFIVEGYAFDGDGRISVDPSGNTYVALDDAGTGNLSSYSNHRVYRVAADGRLLPFVGGSTDYSAARDGSGRDARFFVPQAIASDSRGNSYIADDDHTIRKIDTNGNTSTLAGKAYEAGFADGAGGEARFDNPRGLAVDAAGNVYVADRGNHLIRKITPNGVVSTLAGKAGESGSSDGAAGARFTLPEGLAIDASGNLYVAELNNWDNYRIRIITPAGQVSTRALDAVAYEPLSLASDASGNLFATFSSGIVRLEASGKISLLAGDYNEYGSVDGNGSMARFTKPGGITLDPAGNLYVADGATIRKVTQAGMVSTVAGQPGVNGVKLGALPGGLHHAASVAYGMRHSRPALFVVNRGSQQETLSVAFGWSGTGPLYPGPTYGQSDVNVVSVPLP